MIEPDYYSKMRKKGKGGVSMNMQENARFILGLRAAGWTEKEINDFILYIESGNEEYKPKNKEKSEE